MKTPAKTQK